jgi:ATP-binding cassette, subfamily C, bacterial
MTTQSTPVGSILSALSIAMKGGRDVLSLAPLRVRIGLISGFFIASLVELLGLSLVVPLLATTSSIKESHNIFVVAIEGTLEAIGLTLSIYTMIGFIIAALSLKSAITIFTMSRTATIVSDLVGGLRQRIVDGLLRARWDFFLRQRLGRLAHATGQEVDAVGSSFLDICELIAQIGQLIVFITVCFILSVKTSLVLVLLSIGMFLGFSLVISRSRAAAREHRNQVRQVTTSFTDAMLSLKPLRVMGRIDPVSRSFAAVAQRTAQTLEKRVRLSEYTGELQEPLIGGLLATLFLVTLADSSQPVHHLLIIAIVSAKAFGTLKSMQRSLLSFVNKYDAYLAIRLFLAQIEGASEVSNGKIPALLQRSITAKNVSFTYGDKPVLKKFSAEFRVGEVTALVGHSGVGKSTLLDVLTGLYKPTSGHIYFDDHDLSDLDINSLRAQIGFVPQEVILLHDSILENVRLWDETVTREEVTVALNSAEAWQFVAELPGQLDFSVGERGARLSGGQRQRIAIARALIRPIRLLILDEATTGVDPETEERIAKNIKLLASERGVAVVVVSHQKLWLEYCDNLVRFS